MHYDILYRETVNGVEWWISARHGTHLMAVSAGFLTLLDFLVQRGYQVIAVGDVGGDGRHEVLVRKFGNP